ncbi:hypothetical protein [Desulfobacula phenolica]|uniref:Uncharacterized protein n=1 Tax=Desulfobacula phenolica TaxID=90732 RepID=A0A1H2DMV7_9BACT|nr:hypothetical protein [Desulfobacula phenolica]SDT84230.1 hypothetical protein SAMN04487931_101166 [Desulfobacula phenolica]
MKLKKMIKLRWWNWDDANINAAMPFLLNNDVSALHDFSSKSGLSGERDASPGANNQPQ